MEAMKLTELLMRPENLIVIAAAWSLIQTAGRMFPDIFDSSLAARLKPGASMFLCSLMVWLPGAQPDGQSTGTTVLMGLILGMAASKAHKVFQQTILGNDKRIKAKGSTLAGP